MSKKPSQPAPEETKLGEQVDDNIDDLGRKKDGSTLDQPETEKPKKPGQTGE